jgi:hypothetical protein
MSKATLSESGKNKLFVIDTSKPYDPAGSPQTVQNSPKEDYIVCPDCEQYFNCLETIYCNLIHRKLRDNRFQDNFEDVKINDGWTVRKSLEANQLAVCLLMQSIFWRCHVSDHAVFYDFRLPIDAFRQIEQQLIKFKAGKQKDLLEKIENDGSRFNLFPYVVFAPQSMSSASHSSIGTLAPYQEPFSLLTGDYVLVLYTEAIIDPEILHLSNYEYDYVKTVLIDEDSWHTLSQSVVQFAANITKRKYPLT